MNSALLAAILPYASTPSCYPKKFILFLEGQASIGVWIVLRGSIRMSRMSQSGRNLTMGMAYAGSMIGLSAALASSPILTSAQTCETCSIAFLDRPRLQECLLERGNAYLVAQVIAQELQAVYGNSGDLMLTPSALGRLSKVLLTRPATATCTHQQLADMANCSRETVTRQMGMMQRRGLLTYSKGQIRLLNLPALEAITE